MGQMRNAYKIIVGNMKRGDNSGDLVDEIILMDLKETDFEGSDWFRLAQDRIQWQALAKVVMNLQIRKGG
jgi:hypothetical protein